MSSKKNIFQSMWINVDNRLPPDEDVEILYYNPEYNYIGDTHGRIFNAWKYQLNNIPGMRDKISKDPTMKKYLDGYFATHWMLRWKPID